MKDRRSQGLQAHELCAATMESDQAADTFIRPDLAQRWWQVFRWTLGSDHTQCRAQQPVPGASHWGTGSPAEGAPAVTAGPQGTRKAVRSSTAIQQAGCILRPILARRLDGLISKSSLGHGAPSMVHVQTVHAHQPRPKSYFPCMRGNFSQK